MEVPPIQAGSKAFLRREYTWVAGFVLIMSVLIFAFLDYGRPWGAIAYVLGAVLSGLAGFVGMTVATMANARTTQAARTGPQVALPLAMANAGGRVGQRQVHRSGGPAARALWPTRPR